MALYQDKYGRLWPTRAFANAADANNWANKAAFAAWLAASPNGSTLAQLRDRFVDLVWALRDGAGGGEPTP